MSSPSDRMLCQVLGIVLLDTDGNRLAVKYIRAPALAQEELSQNTVSCSASRALIKDFAGQTKLEAQLHYKGMKLASRNEAEVIMVESLVTIVRSVNGISIYVIGTEDQNELVLLEVLNTVYQALTTITNGQVGRRQILDQLDSVFLLLDEVLDSGVILEIDPAVVVSRVNMSDGTSVTTTETAGHETALNQAIINAKENLMRSFLSGAS